jgi:hypothetical protein
MLKWNGASRILRGRVGGAGGGFIVLTARLHLVAAGRASENVRFKSRAVAGHVPKALSVSR